VNRTRAAFALSLVGVVALCAPAAAEEQGVVRARLILNRVEATLKRYAKLDGAKAKQLMGELEKAAGQLKACKDKQAQAWKKEVLRGKSLQDAINAKAKAGRQAASKPDPKTVQAKGVVDQAEQGLASLKPGDVAAANRLIATLNRVYEILATVPKAERGAHPSWEETRKRAVDLDKKVRARVAEKPAASAAPTPKRPASTAGGAWGRWAANERSAIPKGKIYGKAASATSSYGLGYMPSDALGRPNVFPRYRDHKGAWAPKSETSPSDALEVTFPPTEATHVLIYETYRAGAIRKVLVDGEPAFETSEASRSYGYAQVFWVRLDPEP
jgi:hypothetical protein